MTRLIRSALAAALRALADRLAPVAITRDNRTPTGTALPAGVVGYPLGRWAR